MQFFFMLLDLQNIQRSCCLLDVQTILMCVFVVAVVVAFVSSRFPTFSNFL